MTRQAWFKARGITDASILAGRCNLPLAQAERLWAGECPLDLAIMKCLCTLGGATMGPLLVDGGYVPFCLRDLLIIYDIPHHFALAESCEMSKGQTWNLWHGKSPIGLKVLKRIWMSTGIPLELLVMVKESVSTARLTKHPRRQARGRDTDHVATRSA